MKINKQSQLIKEVLTDDINFNKTDKKIIYKDYIRSFKNNLISAFYNEIKKKEVVKRAKNIERIRKAKTNL